MPARRYNVFQCAYIDHFRLKQIVNKDSMFSELLFEITKKKEMKK